MERRSAAQRIGTIEEFLKIRQTVAIRVRRGDSWIEGAEAVLLLPAIGNSVTVLAFGRIEERLGRQLYLIGVGGAAIIKRLHLEEVGNRAVASRIERKEYRQGIGGQQRIDFPTAIGRFIDTVDERWHA